MMWWSWVIGGAILLGAELTFVRAQFYLVFVGGAAIVTGLVVAATSPSPWAQWALFAVLAIASMVLFRSRVYRRVRGELPAVSLGPAGGLITLPAALAPRDSCKAEYGGSYWTVQNDSDTAIVSGGRARIIRVQDLTLHVRPES